MPRDVMTDEREQQAYGRIEAALARIEAATSAAPASVDPIVADLRDRHERLRGGAAEALARLDRLIAVRKG